MKNYYRKNLAVLAASTDWVEREKRLKMAEQAVNEFPASGEFHAEYGEALAQWHRYGEAAEEMGIAARKGNFGKAMTERKSYFARLNCQATNLTISACAIMKNEMAHVQDWLDNVRVFADEIIVVDTGSSDGTLELLRQQHDVMLIEYQWHDDFAAAKNQALNVAKCDWIVFTDADECFYHPDSMRGWLALVQEKYSEADAALVHLHSVDVDNDYELLDISNIVRILKNHCGIFYKGAVHEQPVKAEADLNYIQADGTLTIRHTGYSHSVIRKKHERNLKLMLDEIKNGNEPALYHGFLAECYVGLQRYDEALESAILAYRSPYRSIGVADGLYVSAVNAVQQLGLEMMDKFSPDEVEEFCYRALLSKKWHTFALLQWIKLYEGKDNSSLVERLSEMYFKTAADAELLLAFLEDNGYLDLSYKLRQSNNMLTQEAEDQHRACQYLQEKEYVKLAEVILPYLSAYTNLLCVSLMERTNFSQAKYDWYDEQIRQLPEKYVNILQRFYEGNTVAGLDFEAYLELMDYVFVYTGEEILDRYLTVAEGLTGADMVRLGDKLLSAEMPERALEFYSKVQIGDEAVTGSFWLNCGKCFYFLHSYEQALSAFCEAEKLLVNSGELSAYMTWCKEAWQNEDISLCDSQG